MSLAFIINWRAVSIENFKLFFIQASCHSRPGTKTYDLWLLKWIYLVFRVAYHFFCIFLFFSNVVAYFLVMRNDCRSSPKKLLGNATQISLDWKWLSSQSFITNALWSALQASTTLVRVEYVWKLLWGHFWNWIWIWDWRSHIFAISNYVTAP